MTAQVETPGKKLKPRDKTLGGKKNEDGLQKRKVKTVRIETYSPVSTLTKTCLLKKDTQKETPGKVLKHVTFEDCVISAASDTAQDNPSGTPSKEDPGDLSQIPFQENNICTKAVVSSKTENVLVQEKTTDLHTKPFDPIRGHRPGKRPMYRGNADWSKEFQPIKASKFPYSFSAGVTGLKPRLKSEPLWGMGNGGKQSSTEHDVSEGMCAPASLSASSQAEPVLSSFAPPVAETTLARPQVVAAVASTASSLNTTSLDSEGADVGSVRNISELCTSREEPVETLILPASKICESSTTATAKTQAASALAQKLRDAFATRTAQPQIPNVPHSSPPPLISADEVKDNDLASSQKTNFPQSSPPPLISVDEPKHNNLMLPQTTHHSVKVQRIIVRDCSSSCSQLGKEGKSPKLQTVIVRRLSSHQPDLAKESSCPQPISAQTCPVARESPQTLVSSSIETSLNNTSSRPTSDRTAYLTLLDSTSGEPSSLKSRPCNDSDKSPYHLKKVVEGLSSGTNSSTKSQTVLKRNCGNLFDNVFKPAKPPRLERIEATAPTVSKSSDSVQDQMERSVPVLDDQSKRPESLPNGCNSNVGQDDIIDGDCRDSERHLTVLSHGANNNQHSDKNNVQNSSLCSQSNNEEQQIEHSTNLPQQECLVDTNLQQTSSERQLKQPLDVSGTEREVVLVGSPSGDYQPVLFDHPYCQVLKASCRVKLDSGV